MVRTPPLSFLIVSGFVCGVLSSCTLIPNSIRSEKRDVYKFDHPFAIESPQFRHSAESLGTTMVDGNDAEILKNGDQIFPAMTRDIREAKYTVDLETYIFKPDEAGQEFADAMMPAARRGVQVRFLRDAFGGWLTRDMKMKLEEAGVQVRVYRPMKLFTIYKVAQRTHRKILVVDGHVAYTGGLGIQKNWLGNARSKEEWRDTQVRVDGPVAAQMQAIFSEDWTYTTGEILAGDHLYPTIERAGPVTAQAIRASKGDASSLAKMLYFVAIQTARKSIHVANPYFLPDKQVREALIEAVKRGVDVQIMVPGRHSDAMMVRSASWVHYGELLKGGVKIFEYKPTMMHHKTLVVDALYATIGSINFDARSMNNNAEESLAFYDHGFAEKMERMFAEDRKNCDEVTYAVWKARGPHKRLTELVFWIWEPYY
jgi:cardiolipin synthase A/B